MMKLSDDKQSRRSPGARSASSWEPATPAANGEQLKAAAEILNTLVEAGVDPQEKPAKPDELRA